MTNVLVKGNQSSTVNLNRGPSPNIWHDCPWLQILDGSVDGICFHDDFIGGGIITSPTTQAALVGLTYSGFGSSGSTITYDDAAGGAVVLSETTVDEGVVLATEQHPFTLNRASGKLWCEGRIKLALTATTENSWCFGLTDTTAHTATVPLTATGAIADINFVGFHKNEANTTAYDASYKANGVTLVEVNSDVGAIANATYFKVGFKYDPNDDYKLRFYINGLECASSKTLPLDSAAGTDFPNDIALGLTVAMAVGAAASDNTLSMDYWRIAQLL